MLFVTPKYPWDIEQNQELEGFTVPMAISFTEALYQNRVHIVLTAIAQIAHYFFSSSLLFAVTVSLTSFVCTSVVLDCFKGYFLLG